MTWTKPFITWIAATLISGLVTAFLLPAAALAACNPGGTELCCESVVETNCLSFSRPSWGGVSATNDCDEFK